MCPRGRAAPAGRAGASRRSPRPPLTALSAPCARPSLQHRGEIMFLKVFGAAAPVALGALYFMGALGGAAYSQDIDQPPERVAQALSDIDLDALPTGEGGPYSSVPAVTMARTADGLSWTLMSGDEVAMIMTASLTPLDDGRRTRVTGTVEKGSLSDPASVSPAFRTPGMMEKLFAMALGAELAEFTASG